MGACSVRVVAYNPAEPIPLAARLKGDRLLIKNYGLFWHERDVFWGVGNNAGTLLGVPARNISADPTDFREQSGVYVLYADYQMVYVGQAGARNQKLFNRLKQHKRGALAGRWNQFSWFGTRKVNQSGNLAAESDGRHSTHAGVLDHIEAILIHAAEPKQNRQGGRFGEDVVQFIQVRDDDRGPTIEEMVRELWRERGRPR